MTCKILTLAACLPLLTSVSAFAQSEAAFVEQLSAVTRVGDDGHYKLVEKRAKAALDVLKDLHGYTDDVKNGAENLRKEMHDNSYEDWINTKLMPVLFDARGAAEIVKKTHELEKKNVSDALNAAKGGEDGAIETTIARITSFEAENETREKAIDARVAAVRKDYEHDFGNARTALAEFAKVPLIQELLAAKPQLVKKIELQPASLRPLQWSVVLQKKVKDSNDPRFNKIPKTITILDGSDSIVYPVVVR
jgi:hypothetical protein